jgi:DNA topoisomerase IA
MQVAQKLYEEGHITYMRTDSTNLSKQAQAQILGFVEKKYGKENAEFRTYATKSKNAQEAHEAIRPTHIDNLSAGFTDEQKSLYKLIWERTVSSQMADAKLMKTKLIANINFTVIPDSEPESRAKSQKRSWIKSRMTIQKIQFQTLPQTDHEFYL